MKLLEVLLECLRSPAGPLLSDDSVCAMVGECFNVRGKTRYNRSYTHGLWGLTNGVYWFSVSAVHPCC